MRPTTLVLWRAGLGRLKGFGRVLLVAWAANLLLALPATLPVHDALDASLSKSQYRAAAARGFDLDWFMDFQSAQGDALGATNSPLLWSAAVALLLSVFLAGGMYGRLRAAGPVAQTEAGEPPPDTAIRAADFLADGARFFPRFFRLFLVTALGYGLIFWFLRIQLSEHLEHAMTWWPSHVAVLAVRLAFTAAVLWLMAWLHMAQDLARLAAVVHDRRAMTLEFLRGLGDARRHFETLAGLYLWGLGGWAVVTVAYLVLAGAAGAAPGAWSWVVPFLLAQLFMLARTWVGFGLSASLLGWYERRDPVAE